MKRLVITALSQHWCEFAFLHVFLHSLHIIHVKRKLSLYTPCKEVVVETIKNTVVTPKVNLLFSRSSRPQLKVTLSYYLHSIIQQRNLLQQECAFKEMSNVCLVVFVKPGLVHCSLKNHLSLQTPPFTITQEVRGFYKPCYITSSWHIMQT